MAAAASLRFLAGAVHAANASSSARASVSIAAAGAATSGISALLGEPGASSTVLEATVPYARASFASYIRESGATGSGTSISFTSAEAALRLGRSALQASKRVLVQQAFETCLLGTDLAAHAPHGIGATGALATLRARAGADHCFVSLVSDAAEHVWHLHFDKAASAERGRDGQEAVCGAAVVAAAAVAARVLKPTLDATEANSFAQALGDAADYDADVNEADEANNGAASTDARTPAESGDWVSHHAVQLPDPLTRLLAAAQPRMTAGGAALSHGERVSHVLFAPGAPGGNGAGAAATAPAPCSITANAPLGALAHRLLIVPGSFNPLHGGHERMALAAARIMERDKTRSGSFDAGTIIVFELSAANVDKAPLEQAEVLRRVAQFVDPPPPPPPSTSTTGLADVSAASAARVQRVQAAGCSGQAWPVVVTSAPRFLEKAALFPGAAFVMGFDTAARLVQAKYYEGGEEGMLVALAGLRAAGTRFFVAGRVASAAPLPPGTQGTVVTPHTFLTLSEHLLPAVPAMLRPLFVEIPEADFREDVSSSQLRAQLAAAASSE